MRSLRPRFVCNGLEPMRTLYLGRILINHGTFTRSISGTKPPKKVLKKLPRPKYSRLILPKKIPPPPEPEPPEEEEEQKIHWIHGYGPLVMSLVTIFAIGIYGGSLLVELERSEPAPSDPKKQFPVSGRYNEIADKFDGDVEWDEKWFGVKLWREHLAKKAKGDVLEVSIGTGRNLEFYDFDAAFKRKDLLNPSDNAITRGYAVLRKHFPTLFGREEEKPVAPTITSFTAVDRSGEMLEIAHQKFSKMYPGATGVRWIIGDAQEKGTIPPPPKNSDERSGNKEGAKYDTIFQTMGLCSVDDPVALLERFGELIKEEEGRIILLEHGRGRWEWVNRYLDKLAEKHARAYGCWWNRDLPNIIEQSGLEVVEYSNNWTDAGTLSRIELKKPKPKAEGETVEYFTTWGYKGTLTRKQKPKAEGKDAEESETVGYHYTPSRTFLTWRL